MCAPTFKVLVIYVYVYLYSVHMGMNAGVPGGQKRVSDSPEAGVK